MKIMSVTYGGGHVLVALSMARAYEKAGIECQLLAMPAAIMPMRQSGRPFKTLKDYAFLFDDWPEIQALGLDLARRHHNPESGIAYEDTADYFGLSMYDLIQSLSRDEAEAVFKEKERKAFLPVKVMKKILDFEQPDFLQVTCDVRMELAATRAAKELGIRSFWIQDAPYLINHPENDFMFLINAEQYDRYLTAGLPAEKLAATGQPCFEEYGSVDLQTEKKRLSPLLLNKNGSVISWFPDALNEALTDTFNELIRIAVRNPDWNLVIKLHPTSHDNTYFTSLCPQLPPNVAIVKQYETKRLIKAADVVIVGGSTVGFEALILDKALIVVNASGTPYVMRYEEKGAALFVDRLCRLEVAIADCLSDNEILQRLAEARRQYESSPAASENIISFLRKASSGQGFH